jgi:hypothetical protein
MTAGMDSNKAEIRVANTLMAMSPGRKNVEGPQKTAPIPSRLPKIPGTRGILPSIVTKSGQQQMDFLTIWQASREILTQD